MDETIHGDECAPRSGLPILAPYVFFPSITYRFDNVEEADAIERTVILDAHAGSGYFLGSPYVTEPENEGEPWIGIGVLCQIVDVQDDVYRYLTLLRVRMTAYRTDPARPALGSWVEDEEIVPDDIEERAARTSTTFAIWVDGRDFPDEDRVAIQEASDPVMYGYELLQRLRDIPYDERAHALQSSDAGARLDAVQEWLEAEIRLDPIRGLLFRLQALPLPETARAKVNTELTNLGNTSSGSSEREHIISYLETVTLLPWGSGIEPPPHDLSTGRLLLDKDHAGMEETKRMILDELAAMLWWARVAAQEAENPPPPPSPRHLLLVGPPGTGKTTILASIAAALGRRAEIVSCGGISDIVALNGFERGYIGARPGAIIDAVIRAGTINLVLGLDEIDKMQNDHYSGDPFAVLMELTDPARNADFTDRYIRLPFDLSKILVVATANTPQNIPEALRDRFTIIDVRGYSPPEKAEIARLHILPRLYQGFSVTAESIHFEEEAIDRIIHEYTYESGLRGLTRHLTTLMQRSLGLLLDDPRPRTITTAEVRRELGRGDSFRPPIAGGPGYGVYLVTSPGNGNAGALMSLEIALLEHGSGQVEITGTESHDIRHGAELAWAYIWRDASRLGLQLETLKGQTLHLHSDFINAYDIQGGSATTSILMTALSALWEASRPPGQAMTGDLSLDGRVLPVGGIVEKIMGAERAGITTVLIPADNEQDLEKLPEDVKARVTVLLVRTVDEVLAATFPEHVIPSPVPPQSAP